MGGAASWGVLLRDVVEIRMETSKREEEYMKLSSRLQNEIGCFYMFIVLRPFLHRRKVILMQFMHYSSSQHFQTWYFHCC